MKRAYILLVALMWGCSESPQSDAENLEPLLEEEVAAPISFSTTPSVSISTRSDIVNESADIASFGVYAYSTTADYDPYDLEILKSDESNVMLNRRVQRADLTDNTSSWSYTPIEYWDVSTEDEEGNAYGDDEMPALYFLAYSPYSSGLIDTSVDGETNEELGSNYDVNVDNGINSYKNNNYIYISYTMPSDVHNQPDILVSEPVVKGYVKSNESDNTDCEPVSFTFNHTLAAVGFKLDGNTSYQVLAVALVGIYDYADLVLGTDANDWDNKSSRYNKDDDIFYNSNNSYYYYYSTLATGLYFAGLSQEEGALIPDADSTTPKIISSDDGYLMVIPQSIVNDVRLHVQYTYASESIPEDYDQVKGYVQAYSSYSWLKTYDFDIFALDYYLGGSRGWYGNNNYYYVITLP
ncbi:MAG: hypothetical protein SNJ33_05915 [Rikenellaceae bacterium]